MAKQKNCPNCGAPYEILEVKCPYCGTAYFDMSMVDMDAKEPFFLKIKVNGMLIVQKVIPETTRFEQCEDVITAHGFGENSLFKTVVSKSLATDLSFKAVVQEKDMVLAKIQNLN